LSSPGLLYHVLCDFSAFCQVIVTVIIASLKIGLGPYAMFSRFSVLRHYT